MKNFRREGKVGEWAICYYMPPYPVFVGEIKEVRSDCYILALPFMFNCWDKGWCSTFPTEEEAKKEYTIFRENKNNYAYEG
jgi:hypothetical protein